MSVDVFRMFTSSRLKLLFVVEGNLDVVESGAGQLLLDLVDRMTQLLGQRVVVPIALYVWVCHCYNGCAKREQSNGRWARPV